MRSAASLLLCLAALVGTAAAAQREKEVGGDAAADETQAGRPAALGNKRSRTPIQRKIDSNLLYALMQKRGESYGVPSAPVPLDLDPQGRVLVDIAGDITARLLTRVRELGGMVISKSKTSHTARARLALEKLEALGELKEVRFIAPAAKAATGGGAAANRSPVSPP